MVFSSLNVQRYFCSTLGIDVRSRASYLHVHQTCEERWPWELLQGHPALHEGRSHFSCALGQRLQADHRLRNGRAPPGHLRAGGLSMNRSEEKFITDPQAPWANCTNHYHHHVLPLHRHCHYHHHHHHLHHHCHGYCHHLDITVTVDWALRTSFLPSFLHYHLPINSLIIDSFVHVRWFQHRGRTCVLKPS